MTCDFMLTEAQKPEALDFMGVRDFWTIGTVREVTTAGLAAVLIVMKKSWAVDQRATAGVQ